MDNIIMTLELQKAVKVGKGTEINELRFREPVVRDLVAYRGGQGGSFAEEVAILASLAGQDEEIIKRLSLEDFSKAREICAVISVQLEHQLPYAEAQKLLEEARQELEKLTEEDASTGEPGGGGSAKKQEEW